MVFNEANEIYSQEYRNFRSIFNQDFYQREGALRYVSHGTLPSVPPAAAAAALPKSGAVDDMPRTFLRCLCNSMA
jgi:hypothetical protein